jgi:hypothetical protein
MARTVGRYLGNGITEHEIMRAFVHDAQARALPGRKRSGVRRAAHLVTARAVPQTPQRDAREQRSAVHRSASRELSLAQPAAAGAPPGRVPRCRLLGSLEDVPVDSDVSLLLEIETSRSS